MPLNVLSLVLRNSVRERGETLGLLMVLYCGVEVHFPLGFCGQVFTRVINWAVGYYSLLLQELERGPVYLLMPEVDL